MSRSNPTESNPNPCTRWFEYAGGNDGGFIRYYDKQAEQQIAVGDGFTFLLLDELATVKGWHDPSDSAIFANEVRDTRQDVLVVKAFKGGELASGLYAQVRDRVGNFGGHFVASCYIAYKGADGYMLGNLAFKGSALKTWMDFKKACGTKDGRRAYYLDAIRIEGFTEGKKGSIVYRTPKFKLVPASDEANNEAIRLDTELQEYLNAYLRRAKVEQVETAAPTTWEVYKQPDNLPQSEEELDEQRAAFIDDLDDTPF